MSDGWDYYELSPTEHFARFEKVGFKDVHGALLRFLPGKGGNCLDVGAGSGRDAISLMKAGLNVLAVEPCAGLLELAQARQASAEIEWVQDSLPELSEVTKRGKKYDFILLSAVWMHLNPMQRLGALSTLSSLLTDEGVLAISLRLAEPDAHRGFFEVSVKELLALGGKVGLQRKYVSRAKKDLLKRTNVQWVNVVLGRSK
jgi:2-polyprenyl-3-methyl-5-hydroxy-6-metoxy-1,4-benzoquinol methylase